MAALVEIDQVALRHDDYSFVRRYGIEKPKAPASHPVYSFDLEGWAIGRHSRFERVELRIDDTPLWSMGAAVERPDVAATTGLGPTEQRIGFYGPVNCLRLPTAFECRVAAVMEDGNAMHIADIEGKRVPLVSPFEPSLRPLIVTTLGRTGSSMFLRALDAHPEIVTYRPTEYEPRAIDFWMETFLSLSEPSSYLNQLDPPIDFQADDLWWLGEQRPSPRKTAYRIREPELAEWMGGENLAQLASIFQSRAELLYEQIAALQRKRPRYFAEKLVPNNTPTLVWELYPEVREVFLVRDFRDVIAAMLDVNAHRGRRELLGTDLASNDANLVLRQVRDRVMRLFKAWRRRAGQAHVVRYEDLVADPRQTLDALLGYLELDAGSDATAAMVKRVTGDPLQGSASRGAGSPERSIGRWTHDLHPDLQAWCAEQLGFALEAFGYSLQPAVPA